MRSSKRCARKWVSLASAPEARFRVEKGVAGIPTAFVASWGQGRPVVGILGEYDALPGLSQEAVAEKRPRAAGASGHGCGHNLLGTAAALACVAVKDYLVENKMGGTIRFYGTPAEEGGSGKIYMTRAGLFDDCDVVLTWHPADENRAELRSSLASTTAKFRFYGQAAHAAAAPEKGRSALDAVMVMTHAIELLREHVPQETRIHYVITNGGAPNVVPDFAEVYIPVSTHAAPSTSIAPGCRPTRSRRSTTATTESTNPTNLRERRGFVGFVDVAF